jgi:hypothetical protein
MGFSRKQTKESRLSEPFYSDSNEETDVYGKEKSKVSKFSIESEGQQPVSHLSCRSFPPKLIWLPVGNCQTSLMARGREQPTL